MFALTLLLTALAPQGSDDLVQVRRAEAQRTSVVARAAAAVCSVMPVKSAGGGSGVIIDPSGFVLTNFHVVQRRKKPPGEKPEDDIPEMPGMPREVPKPVPLDPGEFPLPVPRFAELPKDEDSDDPAWAVMKIGMPDGELYLADVLGIDPGSDLAILLLRPHPEGRKYPAVKLGDSDALLVGETVFAMGNPFLLATDFSPTVTWGVVSGTHRYQPGGGNRFLVYPDCIQVDAPVNPGNSGGPLFNEAGDVVGINGRISVRDRGRVNTGVGFAIASNQVRNFLADMMAGRHSEHGTLDLNVEYRDAPDGNRRSVFVQATFADSVAAKMGVRLGDEITTFNGMEVRSANQLATLVGVLPAGSWVSLGYRSWRRDDDTFGPEKVIRFQLTRLDTGSSRDEDRLASEEQRELAATVLSRDVGAGEDRIDGASVTLRGKTGSVAVHRLGDKLRWHDGSRTLVRLTDDDGFAVEGDQVRELTAEERALVDRTLRTNPALWRGSDRKRLVAASALHGGAFVFGKPAQRYRLAGAGECEVFLFEDGTAAGCRFRDPVAKQMVEYRFSRDHDQARVLRDGALDDGWTLAVGNNPPPAELFERPGQ